MVARRLAVVSATSVARACRGLKRMPARVKRLFVFGLEMTFLVGETASVASSLIAWNRPRDCSYRVQHAVHPPGRVIDCALCDPVMPGRCHLQRGEIPGPRDFLDLNAELAEIWPTTTRTIDPPKTKRWREVNGKRYLER